MGGTGPPRAKRLPTLLRPQSVALGAVALLAVVALSVGVIWPLTLAPRADTGQSIGETASPSTSQPPSPVSSVQPPSAVSSVQPTIAPGASGLEAIPASIDGEPILRGQQISDRIAAVQNASPFLVAGWLAYINADCMVPAAPTPPPFDACGSGRYLTSKWATMAPPSFYLYSRANGEPQIWIGGGFLVVARVHAHGQKACGDWSYGWCRDALTVEAWIDPPAQLKPTAPPPPTPTPEPQITANPLASQIPTAIGGEPVYYGSAIDAHLKAGGNSPFLVVGMVMEVMLDIDCQPEELCSTQGTPYVLIEPGAPHWKVSWSNYPLLTRTGFWQLGATLRWPGDLVVLRVEPSNRGCPAGFTFYCGYGVSDPLIVDAAIAPPATN